MPDHYVRNSNSEEINAAIAGIVSLLANLTLIFATSRVKSYSETVRWAQYNSCAFRMLFSVFVVITAPTVFYLQETKALYIVKGGIEVPRVIGTHFLDLFVVFIVTACTGPMVQYLQAAYLLSNPALKNQIFLRTLLSLVPLLVAIPTFILVYIGYTPTKYELEMSEGWIQEITQQEDSSFLIAPEEKIFNNDSHTWEYDIPARICTFFMFAVMVLSMVVVVVCFSHIQNEIRKKTLSSQYVKSQRQLNLLLMVQFIFPFLTIHIPFFICFILPYFDWESLILASNLPYLFSWCPATNPILVICLVKNVRDSIRLRKNWTKSKSTFTSMLSMNAKNSLSLNRK